MSKVTAAEIHDGIELHMVGDRLYITSETEPDKQVSLSPEALDGLLSYLAKVGVIAGKVEHVEKGLGGAHIYRLTLQDRTALGMLVFEGDAEITAPMRYFEQGSTAEDRSSKDGG